MSASDKTKLDGVATGATANSPDATLLNRANHTGTQASSTISDFAESSRVQLEAALVAGANVTLTPSGSGATRTIAIASTAEGGGGGTVTSVTGTAPIQVASGTTTPAITIDAASTIAAGSMSAADKTKLDGVESGAQVNVATNLEQSIRTATNVHVASSTGTSAILDSATTLLAGVMTSADKTKLDGVAAGATANSSDATLLARANHTGTQDVSTISGLGGAATLSVGTTSGTVAAGDHAHLGVYEPSGAAATAVSGHESSFDHTLIATALQDPSAFEVAGAVSGHESSFDHTLIATALQPADAASFEPAGAAATAVSGHESSFDHTLIATALQPADAASFEPAGAAATAVSGHESSFDHTLIATALQSSQATADGLNLLGGTLIEQQDILGCSTATQIQMLALQTANAAQIINLRSFHV
jgi:hypothetical protein